MTESIQKGLLHHIAAAGRDILVVASVIGLFGAFLWNILAPYWEPFVDLPEEVMELRRELSASRLEIANVNSRLSESLNPKIVEFAGNAFIDEDKIYYPGDTLFVTYFLKRNTSCETLVEPFFRNTATGREVQGSSFFARRAPVTDTFILFSLSVQLPENIIPGRYVYSPAIEPQECGIYKRMRVVPTQVFTIGDPNEG